MIGLGRMAQALLWPLIDAGLVPLVSVRAAVGTAASAERLAAGHPGLAVGTDPGEAWRAPVLLLAVKPQLLDTVAASVPMDGLRDPGPAATGATATPKPLLISVLAGVTLARLQRLFPGHRVVRAVPNTPCLVRAGLTGLAWGEGIEPATRAWVGQLFAQVGEVLELPEPQLDGFLALTSSGPAFVALVAEAMADGAVAAGLPRALAHHLAHRTLAGTAALLHGQELHPGQLKDMVTSPAGTTIAGIRQLESRGVRSALIEAVLAAAERSRELA
ncbi:pyrroline-5-carboxylate reductase [Vulcanococcus limneticus Candia 3F8]|uniref:pyrroline-5-carboxylate reductase n=1 Tax=Vulcanococcus limneticus TaxID=2170428 RepID=UPI000B99AD3D|nr:pyrroline-5-carboxylate reductase [Vulcanococcus limneticus]MCP9792133.1 pyrroline-5-carboxylate reductase [Vulcanococcus limneticus MW73D5]MCP9893973.1 pyrroline-5-carboxylate reductase [Vulcanococcus limneticus Candia 3F8]MCP9897565.1 pyrroline-5-carboxylate reductase [Vulcanococcus limneticus Candia 3B3]